MFLVGLISWWYGRGWVGQWARALARLKATLEFFSVGQLLGTLFDPFRQISASGGGNNLADTMRAALDKLISRCVGTVIRTFTVIFGLILICLQVVYTVIIMIAWWLLPLALPAGLVMFAIGWVPSWL